jgi:adenylate cyclase
VVLTLSVLLAVETAALLAVAIVLLVSRRSLRSARRALERERRGAGRPARRRPRGVAPLAVRTVKHTVLTADAVLRKGIAGSVRSSIDDLAGWARIERPDLKRIVAADGQVALVFSDIEGSTARNAAMGDRAWVDLLERHNDLIEQQVARCRGYVVKSQGDGYMLAFADPAAALRCCADIQRALAADPERWDGIRVRMGVHLGTSVRRGDDLFGLDVATASRVADLADGGQILVSAAVFDAVGDLPGVAFDAPREVELKGVGDAWVHPVALAGA